MEKIISISDERNFKIPDGDKWQDYEGFIIETDKQKIYVGISNHSGCCESWGHVHSEDSLEQFVGAGLKSIAVIDTDRNAKALERIGDVYDGGMMFVNFETSEGLFQLAVYNSHNGYYGHQAKVHSEQLKHEEYL